MAEKMRELVFGEGLMNSSLDGEKRFTVRKFRQGAHDFKKDEIVIGKFKDGLNILLRITRDSKIAPFVKLWVFKCDLAKNGYWFDAEYFEDLKGYYPDLTWSDMGAVVFFEILKVNGVPVVAFNEFAKQNG